ncbi:sugar ABC transporter substrate-binding protein [Tautonia sociabilis]|uniref:Sugar ABC transporter substrate-binding protein n=2 Tax=Tautonia sociabilis TaxID=2080755 RepID=A0A432MCL0_9BACT|nr:sugar ABC transporter substrate-binding protein [Tautonia sociabilis]
MVGCGGPVEQGGPTGADGSKPEAGAGGVIFVGFDGSPPLVEALREGKIQGLVLQNPRRMGYLGVKTLIDHLEGRAVEPEVATGETLATPENMDDPEVAELLNPPKIDHGSDASLAGQKQKRWRVMVIPKGTTHEFWQTIHFGAKTAADEMDAEILWKGPQKEDDRQQQIELVQNAIALGVDGIVLAPLDARALVGPVEQAVARGIPVVIIDSALNSDTPVSYVATDNYNGGVLAARRMGALMGGKGRAILLRYAVGSASTEQREQGFLDTMASEFPEVEFVSKDQYAGATAATALEKSQQLVTRYRGQADAIFAPNESSTFGMLRALEGAGMLKSGAP